MTHAHDLFGPIDALEIDRNHYNAAFDQLGLEWHWDAKTYAELQSNRREQSPVHVYLETRVPHLLRAYDAAFLVNVVESKKTEVDGDMRP
jgi:hypothetical protein